MALSSTRHLWEYLGPSNSIVDVLTNVCTSAQRLQEIGDNLQQAQVSSQTIDEQFAGIVFVGATGRQTSTAITVNFPSGVIPGDLVMVQMFLFGTDPPTSLNATGWNVIDKLGTGGRQVIAWKKYASADGSSVTFSFSGGSGGFSIWSHAVAYRNVDFNIGPFGTTDYHASGSSFTGSAPLGSVTLDWNGEVPFVFYWFFQVFVAVDYVVGSPGIVRYDDAGVVGGAGVDVGMADMAAGTSLQVEQFTGTGGGGNYEIEIMFLVPSVLPTPRTKVLDDFNRANETPVSDGGKWSTDGVNQLNLTSNQVAGNTSSTNTMAWIDSTFGPDCETFFTVKVLPGGSNIVRAYLRIAPLGGSEKGYMMQWDNGGTNGCRIFKSTAKETFTQIAQAATAKFGVGDQITFRALGSVISVYQNGILVLSVVDTTTKQVGNFIIGIQNTTGRLDDFGGGNAGIQVVDVLTNVCTNTPSEMENWETFSVAQTSTQTIGEAITPTGIFAVTVGPFSGNLTLTLPAAVIVGDLIILHLMFYNPTGNSSYSATGWNVIDKDGPGGGRQVFLWRFVDGTEGSTVTVTCTGSLPGSFRNRSIAYRNVDPVTGPFGANSYHVPSGTSAPGGGPPMGPVTLDHTGERPVCFWFFFRSGALVDYVVSSPAVSRYDDHGSSGFTGLDNGCADLPAGNSGDSVTVNGSGGSGQYSSDIYCLVLLGTTGGVTDTLTGQGTNTPSVADSLGEALTSQATSSQKITESQDTGEVNVEVNVMTATHTIVDYVISNVESFGNACTATQSVSEIINGNDVLTNVAVSTQNLGELYETLVQQQTNTPSILDVANGSVSETINATDGADSTGVGGYNVSGLSIQTLLETTLATIVDTTPPQLQSIYASGSTITLVYNENLNPASVPSASAFTVTVNGNPCTVTAVTVSFDEVILTLGCTVNPGDVVDVAYVAPGSNFLEDTSGNHAASFSAPPPTVNTTDVPPPPTDTPGTHPPSLGAAGIGMMRVMYRVGG